MPNIRVAISMVVKCPPIMMAPRPLASAACRLSRPWTSASAFTFRSLLHQVLAVSHNPIPKLWQCWSTNSSRACGRQRGHAQCDVAAGDAHIGERQSADELPQGGADMPLCREGQKFDDAQHAQARPKLPSTWAVEDLAASTLPAQRSTLPWARIAFDECIHCFSDYDPCGMASGSASLSAYTGRAVRLKKHLPANFAA